MSKKPSTLKTVKVPEDIVPLFEKAESIVGKYFDNYHVDPSKATLDINGERYVLVRASALSMEFLESVQQFYKDRGDLESAIIGRNMLYDLAHLIGKQDAKAFHEKMGLTDPLSKLSAGPVHFAHSGWASVNIHDESRPIPDGNFYLKYNHPYSFEADSWIKAGKKSKDMACVMNAGYSSGWCEESYNMPLTAIEISCKAKGDESCTFIMAPPDKIRDYLETDSYKEEEIHSVPSFLQRKEIEEKLRKTIEEKEVLLKEIHHRVKNNLQIICSLLNLQTAHIKDEEAKQKIEESVSRIRSIAVLHELLYKSADIQQTNAKDYFKSLVTELRAGFSTGQNVEITFNDELSDHELAIDEAIPCGMILHEFVSNSIKHAFKTTQKPVIKISFARKDKRTEFQIHDNGAGFDFKNNKNQGLGYFIIESLVDQLDGSLEIKSTKSGTSALIKFNTLPLKT